MEQRHVNWNVSKKKNILWCIIWIFKKRIAYGRKWKLKGKYQNSNCFKFNSNVTTSKKIISARVTITYWIVRILRLENLKFGINLQQRKILILFTDGNWRLKVKSAWITYRRANLAVKRQIKRNYQSQNSKKKIIIK